MSGRHCGRRCGCGCGHPCGSRSRCGDRGCGRCGRCGGSRDNWGDGRNRSGRCDNRPACGRCWRFFSGWTTGDEPCSGPLDRSGMSRGRNIHIVGARCSIDDSRPGRRTLAVSVIALIRAGQPGGCRCLLGRGLLRGRRLLRRGYRLFGLHLSAEPITISLTTGAIRLRVLDGR